MVQDGPIFIPACPRDMLDSSGWLFVRSALWLCERLGSAGVPQHALRELSSMDPDGELPALFRELLGRAEGALGSDMPEDLVVPWALCARGVGLMSRPLVSAHDSRVSLGYALSEVLGELELALLLSADGRISLRRPLEAALVALATEGLRADWMEVSALIYMGALGGLRGSALAAKVASDYHRAALRRGTG